MTPEEQRERIGQVVARAWTDRAFKQRLLSDPVAVLEQGGVEIPHGMEVRVVEDTDKVRHLVLPAQRPGAELSEDQLSRVAGGASPDYLSVTPF